jgi:hypothetical protein
MKLGKVKIQLEYVVDLDNQDMVDYAKIAIYEDVMNAIKYDEIHNYIEVIEDKTAKESDIPEFLIEQEEEQ